MTTSLYNILSIINAGMNSKYKLIVILIFIPLHRRKHITLRNIKEIIFPYNINAAKEFLARSSHENILQKKLQQFIFHIF